MTEHYTPPPMKATQKEMMDAKLSIAHRDFCAHVLIPLNKCRQENFYLPWKCKHEKHAYEKCQYIEYKRRVAAMQKIKAEKAAENLN